MDRGLFDKVLTAGPDKAGKGGMAAVLDIYSRHISPFHFSPTNSARGKVRGFLNFLCTLARIPFERLRGRKILHIHFAGGKSLIRKRTILGLGKALGFKTVMHCHCNIAKTAAEEGKDSLASILRRADHIFVLAGAYREFCRKELGIDNVSVLPNPIEGLPQTGTNIPEPVTFLYLGLIRKEKGIFDLLTAAGTLKDKGYDFRIIVGGVGDMETFNGMIADLDIADRIDYRGWVTDDDKLRAFAQSHVIVLPSYSEGMPMVILEALSAGKPVIASAVGAVPELLANGGGIITQAGDPENIAGAMERYIADTSLIKTDGAVAAAQAGHYTPQAVVTQLRDLYTSLLS